MVNEIKLLYQNALKGLNITNNQQAGQTEDKANHANKKKPFSFDIFDNLIIANT